MLRNARFVSLCAALCGLVMLFAAVAVDAPPLEGGSGEKTVTVAVFDVDATPPTGSRLCYDPQIDRGELGLRCRGMVVAGADKPVVLCAVDWIGIANEGHDAFRETLAEAAGTTADHVTVHVLHQHDAPICDFTSERLLRESGQDPAVFESSWQRQFLKLLGEKVKAAAAKPQPVTHVGYGEGVVEGVASNRRILGPNGKVKAVRFTACKDAAVRAEPEGTIDPVATAVSFWNGDTPVAVLTYYACHPQSYYRTGIANPDFPGIARFLREQEVPVPHIHFNGCGGNIGAGKYNDGSPANRPVLAKKLAEGLKKAWQATKKEPITPENVRWKVIPTSLPPATHLNAEKLTESLKNGKSGVILGDAMQLAWLQRCQAGHKIDLLRLRLGSIDLIHLPGELFVEYQLEAKKSGGSRHVACAAYGDYGPGYIGTEIAYSQGGYETQPSSSFTAPEVEKPLLESIRELVKE